MNVAWGGRREMRSLEQHLWPGETVAEMTTGHYAGGGGLIVLTDRRLFFYRDGWMSKASEDFPMEKVSSVGFHSGMLLGKISVHASGNKAEIENVDKQDGKRIVDNMRARLHAEPPPAKNRIVGPTDPGDPLEKLRRLGELRDAGVVTPAEFEAKKTELLRDV